MADFLKPKGLFGWLGAATPVLATGATLYQIYFTPFIILTQAEAIEIATILMLCLGGFTG